MNLVTGEWIPVLFSDGTVKRIGLGHLFDEAQNITDLAVNPPQRIALTRLLICIAQAALDGPKRQADWKDCKAKIQMEVEKYLKDHFHEFELYGDKPFMQVPTLQHTFNATLDKLDFGLAAGNNAVLFDHGACPDGRSHNDRWIALMLITFLANSPGGKIGVTKWGDISTQHGKDKGPGESEHAPCVESSALHTLLRASSIKDTIYLNLIPKETICSLPNMSWGKPVWELDLSNRENRELQNGVISYLGRLVPLSRAVLFEKGKTSFTLANGLTYPKFPECRETTATVVERKDGKHGYIPTSLDRHPWRELSALLNIGRGQGGAFSLQNMKGVDKEESIDIWTGGLAADKGKILDAEEWVFTVPMNMIGNDGPLADYRKGVEKAKSTEKIIYGAVKTYADAMKMEKAPMPKARTAFWTLLDQQYDVLLDSVNDKNVSFADRWIPLLRKVAYSAFAHACPRRTPRQIQAFAKARQKLKLRKLDNG